MVRHGEAPDPKADMMYPISNEMKAPTCTTIIALSFHMKPTANHKNIPMKNTYIL